MSKITLTLPPWLAEEVGASEQTYFSDEAKMQLALKLAKRNIAEKSGGPFAAAIFEMQSNTLVAAAVNVVVPQRCSLAHAEIMAIIVAQQKLKTYNLASKQLPAMEIITTAQPCIQCFGAIWWSGLKRLVIGARQEDVEKITAFKEGPLPNGWQKLLANRPPLPAVEVVSDCLRQQACQILSEYQQQGGIIYNAGAK